MAKQLNLGDQFPEYSVQTVAGQRLHVPRELSGEYAVLLFYRADW